MQLEKQQTYNYNQTQTNFLKLTTDCNRNSYTKMSYEIVKKIRIENNEVFITSESNNVFPKDYRERLSTYCTALLKNEGEDALHLSFLKGYEEQTLQEGTPNKWSKAVNQLMKLEEYKKYNWRLSNYETGCPIQAARKSKEFNELLLNTFKKTGARSANTQTQLSFS